MIEFSDLKTRLAALPEKRELAKAGDHFAAYLGILKTARERVSTVLSASAHLHLALPSLNCETPVANAMKAVRQAVQLRETLIDNPKAITETHVVRGFELLKQAAESAATGLREAWARGIEGRLREKAALLRLLEQVLPQPGRVLKRIVTGIQSENDPPTSKEAAKRIQDAFAELDKLAGQLELDGAFGDFLRAAASPGGADPKALLDPDVKKGFDKHSLWKSFRVRSS